MEHMNATEITIAVGAVGSVLAFMSSIASMVNTNYKEARARRWAQEDKEELARTTRHTVRETSQSISLQFEEQKQILESIIASGEERLKLMLAKIEENTQVSKEAFKEANGVNAKLQHLGIELRDRLPASSEPQPVVITNKEPIEVHHKTS